MTEKNVYTVEAKPLVGGVWRALTAHTELQHARRQRRRAWLRGYRTRTRTGVIDGVDRLSGDLNVSDTMLHRLQDLAFALDQEVRIDIASPDGLSAHVSVAGVPLGNVKGANTAALRRGLYRPLYKNPSLFFVIEESQNE